MLQNTISHRLFTRDYATFEVRIATNRKMLMWKISTNHIIQTCINF